MVVVSCRRLGKWSAIERIVTVKLERLAEKQNLKIIRHRIWSLIASMRL